MKINCRQMRAGLFSPFYMIVILLSVVMVLFSYSKSYAPSKMSDAELSDIEGQAIFSVNWYSGSPTMTFGPRSYTTDSQDVVRLWLGVDAEMNVHMSSFKMGYFDPPGTRGDIDPPAWAEGLGWDQDTTNYFWGTTNRVSPLRWTGVFVDLGFDSYTSSTARTLNYIEIGTLSASGVVTGTLNTITGLTYGGTGTNAGVMIRQTASMTRVILFNNEVMSFVFATKYRYSAQGSGGAVAGLHGIFIKIPEYHSENDLSRIP